MVAEHITQNLPRHYSLHGINGGGMKLFNRLCAIAAFGLLSASTLADDKAYTMDDLQQLANHQSWSELVANLDDIKPSSRDDAWLLLVDKAGVGFLSSLAKATSTNEAVNVGKVLSLQFPSLKGNDEFVSLYLALANELYSDCFRYQSAECTNEYAQTLEQFSASASMTYQKGVLALQKVSKTSSVPFFALATEADPSYCTKPEVGKGILETLALPKHVYFNTALQVATSTCKSYKLDSADSYLRHSFEVQQVLCESYTAAGYVKGLTKKVCQLVLEG